MRSRAAARRVPSSRGSPAAVTIGGLPRARPRVRFVRHRSPHALARVYFRPRGLRPRDVAEWPAMRRGILDMGAWAFAGRRTGVPVVHGWAARGRVVPGQPGGGFAEANACERMAGFGARWMFGWQSNTAHSTEVEWAAELRLVYDSSHPGQVWADG